jgi:ParB/RepB/Spo0J family partition protein
MPIFQTVPLSSISAPEAPLRHAVERGSLDELAHSIATLGLLQPITVKRTVGGFEVVAGHRRLLACRMAALALVPVSIREDDSETTRAVMLVENLQRSDLTPVEEATAIKAMRDHMGRTVAQIAEGLSRSEAWVRGRIELLDWPPFALEAITAERVSVAALKPLMEIENVVERDRLIGCAIDGGASASVTRLWAAQAQGMASQNPDTMGVRAQAMIPLGDVVVNMPCFCCRESRSAFDLQVVRICRPCLVELDAAAASAANGSPAAAAPPAEG